MNYVEIIDDVIKEIHHQKKIVDDQILSLENQLECLYENRKVLLFKLDVYDYYKQMKGEI